MNRNDTVSRRDFLIGAGAAATLQVSLVEMALGSARDFTFACISDAHLQHLRGRQFVPQWDHSLARAVSETNLLSPKPDFVVFGGDLAQLGTRAELDHGAELLAKLGCEVRMVIGEHDYYRDLGEHWSRLYGPQWYSFDHKGVHFVVLNSILAGDAWLERWPEGAQRMAHMAGLENPEGSPFRVGARQRGWLARDLANLHPSTPLVVFSHSPLQKIHRDWNFWTEDAAQVQALLAPFDTTTVFHGHVHQVQHSRVGNIGFHSVKATAWAWPSVQSCWPADSLLPKLTVPVGDRCADASSTGWQLIDVQTGRVTFSAGLNAGYVRRRRGGAE